MAVEGLSARAYLDHNVDPRLAVALRRHGFDTVFALEVGNERATDEDHLRWAAERGRVLVTFDVKDFPDLAKRWTNAGRDHAGIILVTPPQIPYRTLLRRLLKLLDTVGADDLVNQVLWLDAKWDRPE